MVGPLWAANLGAQGIQSVRGAGVHGVFFCSGPTSNWQSLLVVGVGVEWKTAKSLP